MLSAYIVACCKKPMRLIFDTKNLKALVSILVLSWSLQWLPLSQFFSELEWKEVESIFLHLSMQTPPSLTQVLISEQGTEKSRWRRKLYSNWDKHPLCHRGRNNSSTEKEKAREWACQKALNNFKNQIFSSYLVPRPACWHHGSLCMSQLNSKISPFNL